jgi:hypothetical protein
MRSVPGYVYNKKTKDFVYDIINKTKEYHTFKSLEYQSKTLLEDNLFELIEFVDLFEKFSKNNFDTREKFIINDWNISLNDTTNPYSLDLKNDQYQFNFTKSNCSFISKKIQKVMHILEALPIDLQTK